MNDDGNLCRRNGACSLPPTASSSSATATATLSPPAFANGVGNCFRVAVKVGRKSLTLKVLHRQERGNFTPLTAFGIHMVLSSRIDVGPDSPNAKAHV